MQRDADAAKAGEATSAALQARLLSVCRRWWATKLELWREVAPPLSPLQASLTVHEQLRNSEI